MMAASGRLCHCLHGMVRPSLTGVAFAHLHSLLTSTRLRDPGFIDMANMARKLELVRHVNLWIPLQEDGRSDCEDEGGDEFKDLEQY